MTQYMTPEQLRRENLAYVGTAGVSQGNRHHGFLPAFYDSETGRGVLSRFANGTPAPVHMLDGLPEEWILERNEAGRVRSVKSSVIAGFVRDGWFYTREQAAKATVH